MSDIGYHYNFQGFGSGTDTGAKLSANGLYEVLVDMDNKSYVFKDSSGNTVASGAWTYTGDLVPVIVSFNKQYSHITVDFGQNGYSPSDDSYKALRNKNGLVYTQRISPFYHFNPENLVGK